MWAKTPGARLASNMMLPVAGAYVEKFQKMSRHDRRALKKQQQAQRKQRLRELTKEQLQKASAAKA